MSSFVRRILSNSSTRILVLIFLCIVGITGFFLIFGYYNQINLYKTAQYNKLKAVAITTAINLDGDEHEYLLNTYLNKGDIVTREQDSVYSKLYHQLKNIEVDDSLTSPIYTLFVVDSVQDETHVYYGVNSSDDYPDKTFRDEYEKYPDILLSNYETGSTIPAYTSENGEWISAFHPFKNSKGDVVGVVEVDEEFTKFIMQVRAQILWSSFVSLFFILIIAFFIIRSTRKILLKEEQLSRNLKESKLIIEEKNKDILDSIKYAKKIQDAILPSMEQICNSLPNSFVYFAPRDIVSGDFYWYSETKNKVIIAAIDCTGHGIPGAMMSMIGNSILNEIVNARGIVDPGEILNQLDIGIANAFEISTARGSESKDGMDVAICSIDFNARELVYAGAFRPLIRVRAGELEEFKGDRFPIGGGSYHKTDFSTHTLPIEKGDYFYIFSDGFPDQFGGEKGKKFMNKRFKDLLIEFQCESCENKLDQLEKTLSNWKDELEQVDDILVIGFGIHS